MVLVVVTIFLNKINLNNEIIKNQTTSLGSLIKMLKSPANVEKGKIFRDQKLKVEIERRIRSSLRKLVGDF